MPSCYTFVMAAEDGSRVYGSCLVLWDKAGHELRQLAGDDDGVEMHTPRCLCLLSHWAFLATFQQAHRHDQSLLSLLTKVHRVKTYPLPTASHDVRDVWSWDAGYCEPGFEWPLPNYRVVKAIIYFEDCPPNGGANAVVLGSHRLPFGPGEWSIFMFLPSSTCT